MALGIVGALLLVIANGFFVATEFAITRVRPTQVGELEAARTPGARSLRHAVDHLDAYLAACQLGITVSTMGLGFVGKPAFEQLLHTAGVTSYLVSYTFAFGVVTVLHVVLGELAPKSLAIARNRRTALGIAAPMRAFYLATKPLVDLFNWMGNAVLKPFGIPPASEVGHAPHSTEELRLLLRQSLEQGLIDPEEQAYAENVLVFGERRARQVMVPRAKIDFVTTGQSVREVARLATGSGHTRLPLCDPEHGLERPLGVINAKDLLDAVLAGREPPLEELARPLKRVSESIMLDELLAELRRERRHVALVVDEHGTTIGLVSLEDVIEELVGEIEDEFDPGATTLIRRAGPALIVDGAAPLNAVAAALGITFTDPDEATIGGPHPRAARPAPRARRDRRDRRLPRRGARRRRDAHHRAALHAKRRLNDAPRWRSDRLRNRCRTGAHGLFRGPQTRRRSGYARLRALPNTRSDEVCARLEDAVQHRLRARRPVRRLVVAGERPCSIRQTRSWPRRRGRKETFMPRWRNPFSFLFARSRRDDYLARYVARECARGRLLAEVLQDAYVRNRSTAGERARLLDRPELVAAVGAHAVDELRSMRAEGATSSGRVPTESE